MAEPLSVEDRLDILDLMARYSHAQDEGDVEAFIACYVADPVLDVTYKTVEGAAALREFAEYFAAKPGRPGWQHHITSSVIDGDSERCTVKSHLLFIVRDPQEGSKVSGHATYYDDCLKQDGRWRIARHVVKV
jgi:hypothetical protein